MSCCQEIGCSAILQDPCGHIVCRSHAGCAVKVEDFLVWYHEACQTCYLLVGDASLVGSDEEKKKALTTLKAWVGGFGRNSKGRPYILTQDMADLIFPGAKKGSVVDPVVAAPLLADLQVMISLQDGDFPEDVAEDFAAMNLDVEPMAIDSMCTGKGVVGAASTGSQGPFLSSLSPSPSTDPSTSTSFRGFTEDQRSVRPKVAFVIPKAKSTEEKLKKSLPKKSVILADAVTPAHHPGTVKSRDASSSASRSPRRKSRKDRVQVPPFDPESFSANILEQVGVIVGSLVDNKVGSVLSQLSSSVASSGQSIQSLVERLAAQENAIAGIQTTITAGSPLAVPPSPLPMPDSSQLPEFKAANPSRIASYDPFCQRNVDHRRHRNSKAGRLRVPLTNGSSHDERGQSSQGDSHPSEGTGAADSTEKPRGMGM
ncbi:uncharacterized protein LOC135196468 [Macrobrachium nipponense]|uniref:uncharacterized protein LOC135196468 n=1 Tax=Macrobrachium nipponense TaxID=159736 RepID=UPI0030C82593